MTKNQFDRITVFLVVLMFAVISVTPAMGASVGQAVAKSAAKRMAQKSVAVRQKLGPLHTFRKPVVLERFTKKPALEMKKGLPIESKSQHIFARRIHPGRKGSPEHVRGSLNIPHSVKYQERIHVPTGTRYHERPTQGGRRGQREAILHGHIPGQSIERGVTLKTHP